MHLAMSTIGIVGTAMAYANFMHATAYTCFGWCGHGICAMHVHIACNTHLPICRNVLRAIRTYVNTARNIALFDELRQSVVYVCYIGTHAYCAQCARRLPAAFGNIC
jgi:hypothetical protein